MRAQWTLEKRAGGRASQTRPTRVTLAVGTRRGRRAFWMREREKSGEIFTMAFGEKFATICGRALSDSPRLTRKARAPTRRPLGRREQENQVQISRLASKKSQSATEQVMGRNALCGRVALSRRRRRQCIRLLVCLRSFRPTSQGARRAAWHSQARRVSIGER